VSRDDAVIHEVKRATVARMGDLWSANYDANRAAIRAGGKVASLTDRFAGVPAVVVGAGPSLDRTLPTLAAVAGRVVIIAVDTIWAGLKAAGIEPHLAISLDPQPEIAWFYRQADSTRQYLVAPTIVHPDVVAAWKGEIVFYNKYAPDIPQIAAIANADRSVGMLIPGGTVLSVGFDLAFRMGCEPIAFVGQDLSYPPDGRAYSAVSGYADRTRDDMETLGRGEMMTEVDIFGRRVMTQKNLHVTKQWMEWAFVNLKRKTPCRFYNCTEGGIVTENCVIASFAEWGARFAQGAPKNFAWDIRKALQSKKRR
jgi:hypothetical protein